MPRDSTDTRRRLLEAAVGEFSRHGIAGARVDRIAATAGCNKALLYNYFGNKEQLFQAVYDDVCVRMFTAVPIDAEDLPEYAGRLFDRYQTEPELFRLAAWDRLERGGSGLLMDAVAGAMAEKVAAIERVQAAGLVSTELDPAQLLTVVNGLAVMFLLLTPDVVEVSAEERARQRRTITAALRRLTTPSGASE